MAAKSFREGIRARLLQDVLGGEQEEIDGGWRVLVMDELATKVLSAACSMTDVFDTGVALVEDLSKKRQPMPNMDAVYFISPTPDSVRHLIEDFSGPTPLYKSAHLFFTYQASPSLMYNIKSCDPLRARLVKVAEASVEFVTVDSRTFSTMQPFAMRNLFRDRCEGSSDYAAEIEVAARRLSSVCAALGVFPSIRCRAPRPPQEGDPPGQAARAAVPQRIAAALNERLQAMQRADPSFGTGSRDTCEVLIVDRALDPIAPVVHEFTYEAQVHDLLPLGEGNVYDHSYVTKEGEHKVTQFVLGEHDPLWTELRHMHIAQASMTLEQRHVEFMEKNPAARNQAGKLGRGAASEPNDIRKISNIASAIPEYLEKVAKLSLHLDIGNKLSTKSRFLMDVGLAGLEQDLVYGDAGSKEVINFLSSATSSMASGDVAGEQISAQDKLRLLMCYVVTHPEKMDNAKRTQWMKLAGLTVDDMQRINNMEMLGVAVSKRVASKGLTFGRKKRRQPRKERTTRVADKEFSQYKLARFAPVLSETIEDLSNGTLDPTEFPFVGSGQAGPPGRAQDYNFVGTHPPSQMQSARQNRTNFAVSWANKAKGAEGPRQPQETKPVHRLIVFVAGGVAYNEIRSVHKLSEALGWDIILGATDVLPPAKFLRELAHLKSDFAHDSAGDLALEIDGI
ncbi:unnamed protein product [Pedinophyceae sp. YPF-701]|nr:unnamed protein product [Pedinophyceae sp. YPF-701]